MSQTIERTALTQLVTNEQYARKVLPFMKGDYFSDKTERTVFEEITKFVDKYNKIPTQTSLEIEVQSRKDLNEEEYKKVVAVIQTLSSTDVDFDWLVSTTEKFIEKIKIEAQIQFRAFSRMPWLWVLITLWAMTICLIQNLGSITITP